MKKLTCILALALVFACQKKEEKETESSLEPKTETVEDSDRKPVGADEDAHGCKASAGYTWSELKKDCVRVFEVGTMLNPYDSDGNQMGAFVIFDGDKAEIFIQTEKPFIATRKSEGDQFVYGDWTLVPWKGYVLKKNGKILYTAL